MAFTRYLRFSLRTLLIIVTVLACAAGWLGIEMRKVQERTTAIKPFYQGLYLVSYSGASRSWLASIDDNRLPWYRKLLGDRYVTDISPNSDVTVEEVNRLKELFPEADVVPIKHP